MNSTKKRNLLRRKVAPLLAQQNLHPLYEMRFDSAAAFKHGLSYEVLADTPPSGNIHMSKMFFLKVHERALDIAHMAGREFGGLSLYIKPLINTVAVGERNWRSINTGPAYSLSIDYWDTQGILIEEYRSLTAQPLFEMYNEYFMKPTGLPNDYDIMDFMVFKYPDKDNVWSPLSVVNLTLSVSAFAEIAQW